MAQSTQNQQRFAQSEPYVVYPKGMHTHTVILLHGLGSNGEKFGSEFLETAVSSKGLKLTEQFPGAKFVFPTAKRRRSSAFRRIMLTQWFDIASLDNPLLKKHTQNQGLEDSAAYILGLIVKELELIRPECMVLGGISHGCAMSSSLLLCLDFAIGGFVGLSGWLPFEDEIKDFLTNEHDGHDEDDPFVSSGDDFDEEVTKNDSILRTLRFERELLSLEDTCDADKLKVPLSTPVFIGHGKDNVKIRLELGEQLANSLQLLGLDVEWREYAELGHWLKIPEEVDDIVGFLEKTAFRPN